LAWTIELLDTARRDLRKLDRQIAKRIGDFLFHRVASLENPRDMGDALTGPLRKYWRYRVGDYRVVCRIEDDRLLVLVVRIGHRSEIYR
jgi:mRNA interferase RelE/StbE